jgi:crossover junction endodeoxyribonuclease RuvC
MGDLSFTANDMLVGLDLSLDATGWCVMGPKGCVTGLVNPNGRKELERLDWIWETINSTLLSEPPKLVVLEDFAFSRGHQAHQIGGLGYLIRYNLWKKGIPFVLVGPQQAKKFATGTGTAKKNLIIKEVYKRWKADIDDDNEADAFVLAMIGKDLLEGNSPKVSFQRDILKDMRKKYPFLGDGKKA